MEIAAYFPIWEKLNTADRERLAASAYAVHFRKGEIVHSGDECTGLLLVTSGQLRAYTVSEEGREITMYRLFERDICLFSASCMMRSIQFDITISAEKETDVILIPTEVYRAVMDGSAALANYTNEIMADRFSEVMWLIEQVMWKSIDKRLADFLLNESAIEESDTLKITHEEIGNHMGSAREVITRMLKYFQAEGTVKLSRGTIEITDRKRLEEMTEK